MKGLKIFLPVDLPETILIAEIHKGGKDFKNLNGYISINEQIQP